MERRAYRIEGLDCGEEVRALRTEFGREEGVGQLDFDVTRARMVIESSLDERRIHAAVKRAGLKARPWGEPEGDGAARIKAITTALSGLATLVGMITDSRVAFALGVAFGAWHVLPKAVMAARRLRPDMSLLMCIAMAGAIGIGEWFEASTVAFLFSLSLALEAWSVRRARRAVQSLLELAPTVARCVENGGEVERAPDEVAVGALVRVRPGERVPLDGEIESGRTTLDESLLTGESLPIEKEPGAPVFAGTINGDGVIEFRVTKGANESTVAHIAELVESAGEKRSRSERWVERFALVYTPIVLALAVLVAIIPPLALGLSWADWFYRALVLLVIACPCALVISTPVAIVSGLTAAARHGVLIKDGSFLELPARLRAVAFDKTGTLTLGKPQVTEVVALAEHDEHELLARAAALESGSEHPLARAVLARAQRMGVEPLAVSDLRAVPGCGVEGIVDGRMFWIGSHRWLIERERETEEMRETLLALSGPGRTVMVVGNDEHVCGMLAVADEVRPEAREAVSALHPAGIERTIMLTGDNEVTARAIAAGIGIDEVRAELLPGEKLGAIELLHASVAPLAMVGDGVNDAPALARADLGIAMAAAGSDTAIETADVALMTSDLGKIPWLVHHSRRTLAIIRQNITAALVVKAAFVVLTFAGTASLWAAIAADMGASLAVVANALRLLRSNG
ncbi:MAG: heavy metal translocating P-type ATPase [Planctomycetota bacterium]|jgi:Cd2+/Zn2+-exporting ATPase